MPLRTRDSIDFPHTHTHTHARASCLYCISFAMKPSSARHGERALRATLPPICSSASHLDLKARSVVRRERVPCVRLRQQEREAKPADRRADAGLPVDDHILNCALQRELAPVAAKDVVRWRIRIVAARAAARVVLAVADAEIDLRAAAAGESQGVGAIIAIGLSVIHAKRRGGTCLRCLAIYIEDPSYRS